MSYLPIHVLILSGSIRKPSHTAALCAAIERSLMDKGAKTTLWNLGDHPLPIANPEYLDDLTQYPDANVREFAALAADCDAFVLASPVYHNSYSGVLKNAIDILDSDQFEYKPVGLASSGGGQRSTQAVDHLRIVVRGVLGVAIPTQLSTSREDFERDENGFVLTADGILRRVERFTKELLAFAESLRSLKEDG